MAIKYRVIQVKGAKPELFIVVGIDFEQHMIKSASAAMPEEELRGHLRQTGATPAEISGWIDQGRTYPG